MKNLIIYTTNDKVISLHLVNKIITNKKFKNYKIDIFLSKANFLRKIKILLVIIFFGSFTRFCKQLKKKITIKSILNNNKNCQVIKKINKNKNYEYGLSVYCSSKIKIRKYKIYNFHLGSLKSQRGSFIFFYKFIRKWNFIYLTFHEISERFDVGKIINEKKIKFSSKCSATDIFFIYLDNLNFLIKSIDKIKTNKKKEYKNIGKLNLVPSFLELFKNIFFYFFDLKKLTRLK